MARMPYPDPAQLPERSRAVLEGLPVQLNLVRMLAHSPGLFEPAVNLAFAGLARLELPDRARELAILLVAQRTGCTYEHAQHVPIARSAGIAEEELAAMERGDLAHFDGLDGDVVSAAAELLDTDTWSEATVARLRAALADSQVVELCLIVGQYRMAAGVLNAFAVDVDPAGDQYEGLNETAE